MMLTKKWQLFAVGLFLTLLFLAGQVSSAYVPARSRATSLPAVKLNYAGLAPLTVSQGQEKVNMLELSLASEGGPVTLSGFRLSEYGSASASNHIKSVEIYRDDGNGLLGSEDTALNLVSAKFIDEATDFKFTEPQTITQAPVKYFITLNLSQDVSDGATVGIGLNDESFVLISDGVVEPFTNFFSGLAEVKDTTPPAFSGIKLAESTLETDSINVEFDKAVDPTHPIKYNIYYAPTAAWSWETATKLTNVAVSTGDFYTYKFVISGLEKGVEYTFGVRAEDNAANEDSNTVVLTAKPGESPTKVVVTPVDVAPDKVEQGQLNVPMLRFDLTSNRGTAVWSAFKVDLKGTIVPANISKVKVYQSTDTVFNPVEDVKIGQGSFDLYGQAFIDINDQNITRAVKSYYFVTYDFAYDADIKATAGAKFDVPASSYFVISVDGAMQNTNLPFATKDVNINSNTVTANLTSTAPQQIVQGAEADFIRFTLTTEHGSAVFNSLTINREGQGTDADIQKVKLYRSYDTNWSSSDVLIGESKFQAGVATINLNEVQVVENKVNYNYFVVLAISPTAKTDSQVAVKINSADSFNILPPDQMSAANLPFTSTVKQESTRPLRSSLKVLGDVFFTLTNINEAPDLVRVRVYNEAPTSVSRPPATRLVPMLQLQLFTETKEATWTAIKVGKIGTAATNTISNVFIYESTDKTFDDTVDTTIGSTNNLDNTITLSPAQPITTSPTKSYFVVFEINNTLTPGTTLGAKETSSSIGVQSPDVVNSFSAVSKEMVVITNPHGSPGNPGAYVNTNYCSACHSTHMASQGRRILRKLFTRDTTTVNQNSADVYNALCFSCHDGTGSSKNIKADFNPADATPKQAGPGDENGPVVSPGHMTDQTGTLDTGYLPQYKYNAGVMLPCMVCHDVHNSRNNNAVMLADALYEYAASDTTDNTSASYYWDASATVWGSSATDNYTRRKRCEVCHRNHNGTSNTTSTPGTGSYADSHSVVIGIDLGRPSSHAPGDSLGRDTKWCGACHGVHKITIAQPGVGESMGGSACDGCHTKIFTNMNQETTTYHHYIQNANVTVLASSNSKYPTKNQFTASDSEAVERRCLMCHADHDVFSPIANKTYGNRGKNLRVSVNTIPSPSDSSTFANSDFIAGSGGICLSCHKQQQTKNTAKQANDSNADASVTLTLDATAFGESTPGHNYEATSSFPGNATYDATENKPFEFRANCLKCHNTIDSQTYPYNADPDLGSKQNSTYRFQLHTTEVSRLLAWLNITSQENTQIVLEENFCIRCHSTTDNPNGTAGYDYYNRVAMSQNALNIKAQFVGKTSYHPIGSAVTTDGYNKRHKAIEGESANWNPDGNRHVECEDCHNPHEARQVSTADATLGAYANGNSVRGPNLGVWGVETSYSVIYNTGTASFTNNSATVTGTGTNWLSSSIQPGWYIKNNWDVRGRWYKIKTVDSNTQLTLETPYDGSNFSSGRAGTLVFTGVDYVAANVNYTRVSKATKQYQICLKCHGAYSFDATAPITPSGTPNNSTVRETEVGLDFNPNQLAYHPIMAIGKNQPITPTGQTSGATSYWNTNWPRFTSGTVSINTSGTATFTSTVPSTVIPGWYLYVGATTPPSTTTTNWYQVTKDNSSTSLEVTPTPTTAISGASFALTAGLGNTFVPPYGPWSLIRCSDCHAGKTNEPLGPHGSAEKWILRETTPDITFNWFNGTSVVSVNSNYAGGTASSPAWNSTYSPRTFCFNCHRRDVYGDTGTNVGNTDFDNPNTAGIVEALFSRVPHDVTNNNNTYNVNNINRWGIVCRNCHGGFGIGGIHGTNARDSRNKDLVLVASGASYRGKRFLNGATWVGVVRASTTQQTRCYTKGNNVSPDEVNICAQGHSPSTGRSVANYNYESGTDY